MKLLKAEVLITRHCNCRCVHCKIPDTHLKELNLEQWSRAFDIIYNKLGASFIAIYGGEPMMLGRQRLCKVTKELSKYRPEKSYTVISNSIGLTNDYMDELIANGLDSWTASIDTVDSSEEIDKYTREKSQFGLSALYRLKQKGLRDTCGIITANRKNIVNIPETVRVLNSIGAWAGIDLVHFRTCQGQSGLPLRTAIPGLLFKQADMPGIALVADALIKMKQNGALIFPTYEVLEGWKDPRNVLDLGWTCPPPIKSITVDSDGAVSQCDSFTGNRIKKYSIFDLPGDWEQFSADYFDDIWDQDCHCYWGTHKMLFDRNITVEYYQHKTTTEVSG